MGALTWSLLATLATAFAQGEPIKRHSEAENVKFNQETSFFTNNHNHHNIINHKLAVDEGTKIDHHGEPMAMFTGLEHQLDEAPARKSLFKREAKKPENTKRRKKFSKKKMQQQKDKSESKTESEKSKSKSESKSDESDEDSETPEFSDLYMPWNLPPRPTRSRKPKKSDSSESYVSSGESVDWNKYRTKSEETSESSEKSSKSKKKKSSKSDSSSSTTEEVSLTSEEDTEEIYSGPDSSPPDSSDSTDESSASRHITGDSSEISYTMSSSASVYSSSEETSEESEESEDDESKDKKKKESVTSTVGTTSTEPPPPLPPRTTTTSTTSTTTEEYDSVYHNPGPAEPSSEQVLTTPWPNFDDDDSAVHYIPSESKLWTTREDPDDSRPRVEDELYDMFNRFTVGQGQFPWVSSKSKEKLNSAEPKVTTKITNKKGKKVTEVKVKFSKKENTKGKSLELKMKDNSKQNVQKIDNVLKVDAKNGITQNAAGMSGLTATTQRVLRMVKNAVKGHQTAEHKDMGQGRPKLEMLKVKEAVDKTQKVADLEHDLNRDYPENGTVEIVNWEGTFAPIHGEPYVAPLHHQPDSFWDAIYRSTDADLPTPPGADISAVETTGTPQLKPKSAFDIVMKNKDKRMRDEKKPGLSIKERKKKKREKKEKKLAEMKGTVDVKASALSHSDNLQIKFDMGEHDSARIALHNAAATDGVHAGFTPYKSLHAAGKSEETLKTPSEEERESGTTYKPEGAYEYPSFRHPDFNPDTAYDENGIPIHESPGWTPPPTLPGDNRFGKDRSRAGAGLASRVQAHGPITLAKPQLVQPNTNFVGKLQDLHKTLAVQEHQQLAEALTAVQMESAHNPSDMNMKAKDKGKKEKKKPKLSIKEKKKKKKEKQEEKANSKKLANEPGHNDIPLILPALHQGFDIKDTIVKHKIQKRSDSQSESKESVDSKPRQRAQAKDYKAYSAYPDSEEIVVLDDADPIEAYEKQKKLRTTPLGGVKSPKHALRRRTTTSASTGQRKVGFRLTESELLEKEKSAPLEAINPDLYMYRNMLKARRKRPKLPLDKIPDSAEVIAVVVGSKGNEVLSPMKKLHKIPLKQKPVVYKKDNEALNPLLYKYRNMFKVSDLKDDGMKMSKDTMMKQTALNSPPLRENTKAVPLDEFVNGNHALRGRGRENFNPLFLNQNKMFTVRTNKFKHISAENHIVKREVEESQNPLLYSYKNMFSSNPKQVLPLKNSQDNMAKPSKPLNPAVKNYVKESQNPLLYSYQNIFSSNPKQVLPLKNSQMGKNKETIVPFPQRTPSFSTDNMAKQSKPLDPTVMKYMGRNKENLNPYLYKYPNMFTVDSKTPPKETFGIKNTLHKVQLENGGINPLLFAQQKMAQRPSEKVDRHKIKKREV